MMQNPLAGINGFGRFGLGLFRAWFEDAEPAYTIAFINDDVLTIADVAGTLQNDPIVTSFRGLEIRISGDMLRIYRGNNSYADIKVTTGAIEDAYWLGRPAIIFDCSSRASNFKKYATILLGSTRVVLIGATTPDAQATLVMGYNETSYDEQQHRIISFGSCTVIPGVHVINLMQSGVGLKSVLVNIVHSVPKWQLEAGNWNALARKSCSLESVAPQLIESLSADAIKVNYTYAPYWGVSLMDFAFTLNKPTSRLALTALLTERIRDTKLMEIVRLVDDDDGANRHLTSSQSISVITSSIDVRGDRAYFFGYFNNEGSGIRLHELSNFIVERWR